MQSYFTVFTIIHQIIAVLVSLRRFFQKHLHFTDSKLLTGSGPRWLYSVLLCALKTTEPGLYITGKKKKPQAKGVIK